MDDSIHIIGAGLIGLSTADSLIERGKRVTIWDTAPAPGMGASFSNGALIHPSQSAPWIVDGLSDDLDNQTRDELARNGMELAKRSGARLTKRMEELGLPDRRQGVMQVFGTDVARDKRLAAYARMGVFAEPTDYFGHPTVSIPGDSCADARAYSSSMAQDLAERGVQFNMCSDVGLGEGANGLYVECGEERFDSRQIVVAAGRGTSKLLRGLGLDLPVMGVAGHALGFIRSEELVEASVMHADSRTAMTVLDDEVRISGSVGLESPSELLPIWRELVPDLMEGLGEPRREWTGYRPCTPDGKPIMGATPISGLYVNTGHAHMGWTLCAGAGELVAEDVVRDSDRQAEGVSERAVA